MMQLAELVKKHDLFLIADEVYREFTYDGDVHYSVMNIRTRRKIMIDSVSKIQYVWCKNWLYCFKTKELMGCNEICTSKISPPTFAQVASEAALDTPQSYFDE
jgi:aspartate aminotransferase